MDSFLQILKLEIFRLKPLLVAPRSKGINILILILKFLEKYTIQDFSVWLRTYSNKTVIYQFLSL